MALLDVFSSADSRTAKRPAARPDDMDILDKLKKEHDEVKQLLKKLVDSDKAAERTALLREIDIHHGNISRVAQKLGIGRNTLYRKMRRLDIAFPARQSARQAARS